MKTMIRTALLPLLLLTALSMVVECSPVKKADVYAVVTERQRELEIHLACVTAARLGRTVAAMTTPELSLQISFQNTLLACDIVAQKDELNVGQRVARGGPGNGNLCTALLTSPTTGHFKPMAAFQRPENSRVFVSACYEQKNDSSWLRLPLSEYSEQPSDTADYYAAAALSVAVKLIWTGLLAVLFLSLLYQVIKPVWKFLISKAQEQEPAFGAPKLPDPPRSACRYERIQDDPPLQSSSGTPKAIETLMQVRPKVSETTDRSEEFGGLSDNAVESPDSVDEYSGESEQSGSSNSSSITMPSNYGPYKFIKMLGSGGNGTVYLAQDTLNKRPVAIKVIKKHDEAFDAVVKREKSIMIKLQNTRKHPHILEFYDDWENEAHYFLVLEYAASGDMFTALHESPGERFPEATAAVYFYQAVRAVAYCHVRDVIHRDIKPENFLLVQGKLVPIVKVSDFGHAVETVNPRNSADVGTLYYRSPEQVEGIAYDKSVDIWAVGILLYEMLVGRTPFEPNGSTPDLETRIASIDLHFPEEFPVDAEDLIRKLLAKDPANRISLKNARQHPWVAKYVNAKRAESSNSRNAT